MKLLLADNSPMNTKQFVYGVATASFQIEGGAESRLPCIWDTFCNTPNKIADKSNGLVACDHFNKWQDDVSLIKSLGVDAYRLSISWPRVMHKDGSLNQQGMDFYVNLVDALNANNIKVFVTLYHWDLPQYLEDNGGWLNRETAYAFAHYADCVSTILADKVHSYATLNEPFCSSYLGYEVGIHAPGKTGQALGRQSAHHLLLAHGLAMPHLKKNAPKALSGIVLNFTPCYPASQSEADKKASDAANQYFNLWYIEPLFNGKYPELIEQLPESAKPDILAEDMAIISHPLDFLGVNYYTRAIYRADTVNMFHQEPPKAPLTDIGWEIYPAAFTELLVSLNKRYQLPPVYITENGAAMADKLVDGQVNDQDRIHYFNLHLAAVNNAIEQGVYIKGYFAWSLMDNFEWAEGYNKRFGIVYVDYQTQQRTIKASGIAFKQLIAERK